MTYLVLVAMLTVPCIGQSTQFTSYCGQFLEGPAPRFPAELLERMYWIHFPKAGTSFANTILHYCCPGLAGDTAIPSFSSLSETQKLIYTGSLVELFLVEQNIGSDGKLSLSSEKCRRDSYRSDRQITSHFPVASNSANLSGAVAMFRNPITRILSAFHHNLHSFRMGPGSNRKMRNKVKSVEDFANWPGISGCQTKMMLGQFCGKSFTKHVPDVPQEKIKEAVEKVKKFSFVGLTEYWNLSICLFHAQFGGEISSTEFENSRMGVYTHTQSSTDDIKDVKDSVDEVIYKEALRVFVQRLEKYGFKIPKFLARAAA